MKHLSSSSVIARVILFFLLLVPALQGCTAIATQQSKRAPAATPTTAHSPQASPSPAVDEAIDRATSEPYDGDLSIFEDTQRDQKLHIERVMDVLGIREGSGVADIGAGSGWFTVRAARRAGLGGTVYAVEINREYLKHIEERAASEKLSNVRAVLGKEDDPLLPEKSVDAVLILKTYHETPSTSPASLRPSRRGRARRRHCRTQERPCIARDCPSRRANARVTLPPRQPILRRRDGLLPLFRVRGDKTKLCKHPPESALTSGRFLVANLLIARYARTPLVFMGCGLPGQ